MDHWISDFQSGLINSKKIPKNVKFGLQAHFNIEIVLTGLDFQNRNIVPWSTKLFYSMAYFSHLQFKNIILLLVEYNLPIYVSLFLC